MNSKYILTFIFHSIWNYMRVSKLQNFLFVGETTPLTSYSEIYKSCFMCSFAFECQI